MFLLSEGSVILHCGGWAGTPREEQADSGIVKSKRDSMAIRQEGEAHGKTAWVLVGYLFMATLCNEHSEYSASTCTGTTRQKGKRPSQTYTPLKGS